MNLPILLWRNIHFTQNIYPWGRDIGNHWHRQVTVRDSFLSGHSGGNRSYGSRCGGDNSDLGTSRRTIGRWLVGRNRYQVEPQKVR
jgi:hypothetical protein